MLSRRKHQTQKVLATVVFLLFRKSPSDRNYASREKRDISDATDFSRIRCPQCRWQPTASSRWFCAEEADFFPHFYNGCGTMWNTFETRGRCPRCSHEWKWTDCLRCGGCSPHEAWYEESRR